MIDTGGVRAWRFLKRNPDYIEAQGKAPAAAPEEPAPFPSAEYHQCSRRISPNVAGQCHPT